MQLQWSHAFVYVQDMDTMLDFYTNVLGFEVTDRGPLRDGELVFLSQNDTDHHQLGFTPTRQDMNPSNTVAHFAFRVANLDDVKSMHAVLQEDSRVSEIRPVTHGNAWSVYFNDPEGNGIEIFCDTPWHVQQPQGGSWDPSASNEEIFKETEEAISSTGPLVPIEEYYSARATHLREREARSS